MEKLLQFISQPCKNHPGESSMKKWYSLSSSSKCERKREDSSFKSQNKNKKMPSTVAPVVQKQQHFVKFSQEHAGCCRLCVNRKCQAEDCTIPPLQVRLTPPLKRQNTRANIRYSGNWSPPRRQFPQYWDPIDPFYCSSAKPTVTKPLIILVQNIGKCRHRAEQTRKASTWVTVVYPKRRTSKTTSIAKKKSKKYHRFENTLALSGAYSTGSTGTNTKSNGRFQASPTDCSL